MSDFTKNLTSFNDHPLVAHKVTHLCDINTGSKEFCEIVATAAFPVSEEGLEQTVAWLEEQAVILNA